MVAFSRDLAVMGIKRDCSYKWTQKWRRTFLSTREAWIIYVPGKRVSWVVKKDNLWPENLEESTRPCAAIHTRFGTPPRGSVKGNKMTHTFKWMTLPVSSWGPLFLMVLHCFWIPSCFAHTWNQPPVCCWHTSQEAAPLPGRPFTQNSSMLFFISTWNFRAWYIARFLPSPDSGAVGVVGAHELWSQMDLTAVTKAV